MPSSHSAATWVSEPESLQSFLGADVTGSVIGIDTEFMRRDTFYPKLALIQLSVDERIALVDPLAFDARALLKDPLQDPHTVCIMHSASEDMEALSAVLPHGPGTLFDTQIAAAMSGMGPGLSYQNLVQAITGVELPKGETRSDWMRRPLSESQREYAAQDVLHLHELHATLQRKLADLDRLEWLQQDCIRLTRRAEHDRINPQPQRALPAASDWPKPKQALLRRILLWREHTAREVDTPRPWLFDDKLALSLVSEPPASSNELSSRVRGQRSMRSAQRQALLELLQRPITDRETETTEPIPPAPGRGERDNLKAMKHAVDTLATELDLPPGLLCPRRLLEELLMTRAWPEGLEGWRRALLEPRLLPLLT